jgi:CHASE2 domain-containing sensor protein
MGVGAILLLWGLPRGTHAWRRRREDPLKPLTLVRGYRIAIVGVCLSAYSLGWWQQINTLMTVALVICLEEIAESSFYIAALKRRST